MKKRHKGDSEPDGLMPTGNLMASVLSSIVATLLTFLLLPLSQLAQGELWDVRKIDWVELAKPPPPKPKLEKKIEEAKKKEEERKIEEAKAPEKAREERRLARRGIIKKPEEKTEEKTEEETKEDAEPDEAWKKSSYFQRHKDAK